MPMADIIQQGILFQIYDKRMTLSKSDYGWHDNDIVNINKLTLEQP